jgi:outer membrane protein OmpA-like peptidoglycan-associated protein
MTRNTFYRLALVACAALAVPTTIAAAEVSLGTSAATMHDYIAVLGQPYEEPRDRSLKLGEVAAGVPSVSIRIPFAFNSDRIPQSAVQTLDQLAAAMQNPALRKRQFKVIGHTDSIGSPSYNMKLSQRRAASVQAYLAAKGVTRDRLRSIGAGKSYPLDKEHPEAPENRRVQIAVDV